ncbi:MAG: BACON domain-containing protein [Prevotella sp.]|nr:BACON domain-containing protein [Prevotella sp.]
MKLKYFIPSLVAVVAAMFTGCSEDQDPTYLDGLRVSQSYVALPTTGSPTASIEVTANGSWTISGAPDWLTVSPTSGTGSGTVSFSAAAAEGRTAEVILTCGDLTQRINVIQGIASVQNATCAEVLAGPEAKTYRVTGVCVDNPDNQYGNWHIDDGTGNVYVYGTLDKKGNKGAYPISGTNGWGFGPGDVVTVEGPKSVYNGTVELVDVTVIKIVKSLVKIEEGDTQAFDADGGNFTVRLTVNGDGPYINIDEDAQEWLGVTSVVKTDSTTNVNFHVAKNNDEQARKATISFTSTSGSSTSTVTATVSQMGLSGTLTNPFSVADAIAYCQTLTAATANDFYVKGKISKIVNNGLFSAQYGNATFWISDDGEFHDDLQLDFEAYRVIWLGNKKWAEGNAQIAEGDEVLICGKLTNYKGTSETSSGAAHIYSINGVTEDANGIGNLEAPFNIAGAKAVIDNGFTGNVFVKGIVSSIANNGQFGSQYGNGTFWISDDGTSNDFEAYRVLWLGNKKWVDGDDPIAVGDEVILHGQLTKYGSTYETSSGKAYVYSVNGKTE